MFEGGSCNHHIFIPPRVALESSAMLALKKDLKVENGKNEIHE
jgi:hypothetical protein